MKYNKSIQSKPSFDHVGLDRAMNASIELSLSEGVSGFNLLTFQEVQLFAKQLNVLTLDTLSIILMIMVSVHIEWRFSHVYMLSRINYVYFISIRGAISSLKF